LIAVRLGGVKSPDELTVAFRERGLKVTPQRRRIFEVVHGNDAHPTAEAVYESVRADMPTISLRTVYQTLHDLADLGEIQQLDLGTGSARFDPNVGAHHHLVCGACGAVTDLEATFAEVRVPRELRRGFEVTSTEIIFRGVCVDCRAAAGDDRPADRRPAFRSTTPGDA
jgi:Fe2+ or Zn2+ uptake regulation protein